MATPNYLKTDTTLVDPANGAVVSKSGFTLAPFTNPLGVITFADGTTQGTASVGNVTQQFSYASAQSVVAGAPGTPNTQTSTELTVTGGLAIISLNVDALAINTLTESMILTIEVVVVNSAAPNAAVLSRQLSFVSSNQQVGPNFAQSAIVQLQAGTEGIEVQATLTNSLASTSGEVTFTPDIRVDYI